MVKRNCSVLGALLANVAFGCGGSPGESGTSPVGQQNDSVASGTTIHETVVRSGPDGVPVVTETDVPIEEVWAIGNARRAARTAYLSGESGGAVVSALVLPAQKGANGTGSASSAIQIGSCGDDDIWLEDTDNGDNCSNPSPTTRLLCFNAFDGYSGSYYLTATGTQYNVGSHWNTHVVEYSPGTEWGNMEFEVSGYPDGCWQSWSIPTNEFGCYHPADAYSNGSTTNPSCSPYTATDLVALSE
jgi:hypothetical protein